MLNWQRCKNRIFIKPAVFIAAQMFLATSFGHTALINNNSYLRNSLGINKERYEAVIEAVSAGSPLARGGINLAGIKKFFDNKDIAKIAGILKEAAAIRANGLTDDAFMLLEQMEAVIDLSETFHNKRARRLVFLQAFQKLENTEKDKLKDFIATKKIDLQELFEITDTSWWIEKRGVVRDPLHNQEELKEWLVMSILKLEDIWQDNKIVDIGSHKYKLLTRKNKNVYQAIDTDTGDRVVIKVSDEREELISGIAHHLDFGVRVIGYDSVNYLMVLEDVGGKTLQEISDEGSLNLGDALNILSKVGEYVESLRQRGIAHNDIAPRNIIVSNKGIFLIDYSHAWFSTRLIDSTDYFNLEYLLETLRSPGSELLKEFLNSRNTANLSDYNAPITVRIILEEAKERLDGKLNELVVKFLEDKGVTDDQTKDLKPIRAKLASLNTDGKVNSLPSKDKIDVTRFMIRLRLPADSFTKAFSGLYPYSVFPEGSYEYIRKQIYELEGYESGEAFDKLADFITREALISRVVFAEYLRWYHAFWISRELKISNEDNAEIWKKALKVYEKYGIFATVGFLKFAPYLINNHGVPGLTAFTDALLYNNIRYMAPDEAMVSYDQLRHSLWQDNKVMRNFNYADPWMTFSMNAGDGIEYIYSFGVDKDSSLKIAEIWKKDGEIIGYGGNALASYHANLTFRIFEGKKSQAPDRVFLYNVRLWMISAMFPNIKTVFVSPSQFGGEGSAAVEYAMRAGAAIFYVKKIGMFPVLANLPEEKALQIQVLLLKLNRGLRLSIGDLQILATVPMGIELSDDWKYRVGRKIGRMFLGETDFGEFDRELLSVNQRPMSSAI